MWEQELRVIFTEKQWEEIWENTFKVSIATKLREFQYRLINRTLKTNVHLSKWKQDVSNKCTFCHRHVEMARHKKYGKP